MQERDGTMHPVAVCARRLRPAEINYTTTEQEFLAMVFCFQSWRCYLEGLQVFAHTDHEPLTWLSSQKSLSRPQSRLMEYLSRFTYSLLYVKGDENVCADALSRMLQLPLEDAAPLPSDTWPHEERVTVLDVCRHPATGLSYAHPSPDDCLASNCWPTLPGTAGSRHARYLASRLIAAAARHSVTLGGHTRARHARLSGANCSGEGPTSVSIDICSVDQVCSWLT
jgi:hypothetical protein